MFSALFIAAVLVAQKPDPVFDYYRGVWHCDGMNYRHRTYSLTYRYTNDADVSPVLRTQTVYFVGKRRGILSGQIGRTRTGTYIQTGARSNDMWVSASAGWHGDTIIWTNVTLPRDSERDRLTVRRISENAFTQLDERLGPGGEPNRTNTTATCRRKLR